MVPVDSGLPRRTRPAHVQGVPEKAADRIRTDDLLHGKPHGRQLDFGLETGVAANLSVPRICLVQA